jgi:hypothetical protein
MITPQELLERHGIKLASYAEGKHNTTCPKCSAKRSRANQKTKCLGVLIDEKGACWRCNHCDWTGPEKGKGGNGHDHRASIEAAYDYIGFQKVRFPKGHQPRFAVRRSNGHGGWVWGAGNADTNVLYRRAEVDEAIALGHTILLVEGEKDVESAWCIGIPATCNSQGASEPDKKPKWKVEHSEQLRGADIVVIPDHDPPGYAHADATCRLSLDIAKRVRRLDLAQHWPDCPKGGDLSDWLAAGHTREDLDVLIAKASDYQPTPAATGLGEWDAGDDVDPPPPRGWLLGNSFCRGYSSSCFGAGGIGKTALRYAQALSAATKRELTGEYVFQRCRVLIVSLEDDAKELRRRILAARLHHNIPPEEVRGWLFLAAPGGKAGKLMTSTGKARVIG